MRMNPVAFLLAISVPTVAGDETWTYPLNKLDNGGTSVTSTGANTKQLTATVHAGASLGDGRVAGTKAIQFDGVGKTPADGQHVSIDGGVTVGGSAFTACSWTKWDKFGHYSRVIDIGNGQSDNIVLCNEATTNTLRWNILRGDAHKYVYIGNILQPNTWTHVCGTVSATGTMAVLLNGVQQKCTGGNACDISTGKGSNGHTPNRLLRSNAYIGRSSWNNEAYFAGSISDVTLIDGKAVTGAEAVAMMLVVPFTWTYPLNVLPITSTGENNGQLTATVHAGASLGDGRVAGTKAIQFDGVGKTAADGQHVSIDGGVTVGGSAFTACSWTKWDKFGHWSMVIDIGNGPNSDNIYLANRENTNTLVWQIYRGDTHKYVDIGNILQLNTWTHVCGTVSASGYMAVLLNGVEQKCTGGTACDTSTGMGSKGWTPNRLLRSNAYIGRANWDTVAYFAGSISDVTLIDGKAVTGAEAVAMMLVVPFTWTYPLNVLPITSTGENNGQLSATVHAGARLGDGKVEGTKALQLDGVGRTPTDGQHVSIDGGVTVGGGAFTACAWAKWDEFGDQSRVIDFGNGVGSDNILLYNAWTTNTLQWGIYRGNSYKYVPIGNILQPNTWTHVCGTVSTTGAMAVLVNGVEQKCTSGTACDISTGKGSNGHTPIRLLRSNAYIGRSNWDNNAYFAGSISDVALIDGKAVTEAEAVAMMRATDPNTTITSTSTTSITTTTTTTIPTLPTTVTTNASTSITTTTTTTIPTLPTTVTTNASANSVNGSPDGEKRGGSGGGGVAGGVVAAILILAGVGVAVALRRRRQSTSICLAIPGSSCSCIPRSSLARNRMQQAALEEEEADRNTFSMESNPASSVAMRARAREREEARNNEAAANTEVYYSTIAETRQDAGGYVVDDSVAAASASASAPVYATYIATEELAPAKYAEPDSGTSATYAAPAAGAAAAAANYAERDTVTAAHYGGPAHGPAARAYAAPSDLGGQTYTIPLQHGGVAYAKSGGGSGTPAPGVYANATESATSSA
eukprot:gene16928-biopygen4483